MTLNVHAEVWRWFRSRELRTGISKTRLVAAGIAALRLLTEPERQCVTQWVSLIDEEKATWAQFEKACDAGEKERLRALKSVLADVIGSETGKHRESSPKRPSGKHPA